MPTYIIEDQLPPRKSHSPTGESWGLNLVKVGELEARSGSEAIDIARRKKLSRYPIVSEKRVLQ